MAPADPAGDVSLTSNGTVTTHGNTSYGLLAQSVGNGGGNSSSTSVSITVPENGDTPERAASVAVGLEGGLGGFAGNVTLNASGTVIDRGEDSHAIFAQSVGGGGGNGGSASGLAITSSTAALAIGGTGGQGGTGGNVDVISSAQVRTHADRSVGILAQSVGGAGGTGGMVKAGGVQSKGSSALIAVGGSGGTGMTAGKVTVLNSGIVITDGADSHGVLAQSIGGGGGNAAMVINSIVNRDAAQATQLGVSVGGSGGSGATSGEVIVTNTGGIGTSKINSVGIFAQSIGGGGGNANKVITGAVSTQGRRQQDQRRHRRKRWNRRRGRQRVRLQPRERSDHHLEPLLARHPGDERRRRWRHRKHDDHFQQVERESGRDAKSTSVAFSLGRQGRQRRDRRHGHVSSNAGSITTYGYKSHGIVAQSIGGGGGNGGTSIAGDLSIGGKSTQSPDAKISTISVGGFGGTGNRGGDVTVRNSGSIVVQRRQRLRHLRAERRRWRWRRRIRGRPLAQRPGQSRRPT